MTKRTDPRRRFNTGHFPQGTIVETKLRPYYQPDPDPYGLIYHYEVKSIHRGGADNWIINTYAPIPDTDGEYYSFSTSHVTAIISRGSGKMVYDNGGYEGQFKPVRYEMDQVLEKTGHIKHPSKYACTFSNELINAIIGRYMSQDMMVDDDKMIELLYKQGLIQRGDHTGEFIYVNKKKLQKAVKRLINKCLMSKKDALKFEEEMFDFSELEDRDYHNVWTTPESVSFFDLHPESTRASEFWANTFLKGNTEGRDRLVRDIETHVGADALAFAQEILDANPGRDFQRDSIIEALKPDRGVDWDNHFIPEQPIVSDSDHPSMVEDGISTDDDVLKQFKFKPYGVKTLGDILHEWEKTHPLKSMKDLYDETLVVKSDPDKGQ